MLQQCIYKYIYESISFLCYVLKRPHLGEIYIYIYVCV